MATNFRYAYTAVGLMKIVHLVFGAVSLGCISATFDNDDIRDRYFFGAILACFLVSLIYFIIHLVSYGIAINIINKAVDAVYHFIGAVLLIVGASLFLQVIVLFNQKYCDALPPALDINYKLCGGIYHTKISAGAFGLVNGVLYLVAVVLRSVERNDDEQEPRPEFRK